MKECKLGIWNETLPGFTLDESGVSNYARIQEALMNDFPLGEGGTKEWDKIIENIKSSAVGKKYDCIIGISGGTDSSYLLHLAKKWGLRPLAVNLDNGWNSDIAVRNIHKMTSQLNIDLETYVIDYEEMKDILRSYLLAGLPWLDNPTDQAIKAILYTYARKEGVKTVIIGTDFRSEGKQPSEWTYGDYKQLSFVHKTFGKVKRKTYPENMLLKTIWAAYIRKIRLISPFNYIAYDKKAAQEFLEKNYDWKYYGEHHHENLFTKWVISYWMYEKFNIDKRIITYSAQVLNGTLNREEALQIVSHQPYKAESIGSETAYVLKKLGLSETEFKQAWEMPSKTFRDYPSYFDMIHRFAGPIKVLARLVLKTKPKLFYELENRK
ncbi:MAG: N-acetyl sugar amidotransferase [Bacteroidia bacterium]